MSKNWAICIGINGYHNLKSLKYARRDAEAMRDFCLNEAGFDQVYFFGEGAAPIAQDHGPPLRSEPTFGTLERFLDVRFREPFLEAGDSLWFFFAGHGRRSNQQDYLMPIDSNPGNVERTGIAISDIANRLRGCGADNVVLMLDACRDEDSRSGGQGIGIERQQGVVTVFACSPNELSYEIDELQQGAFTYALLEGLRIQGEGNCATVERLYQHLRYQVPELNRRYKKAGQTPYVIAEPATKLHLILLPERATLQDVQALKVDALEAEAERDWDLAEQLWIRVLTVSPGDRRAVKALMRIARATAPYDVSESRVDAQSVATATAGSRRIQAPTSTVSSSPKIVETQMANPPQGTVELEVVTVDGSGNITQRQQQRAIHRQEDLGQGVVLDLVQIPGGNFQMGSPPGEGDDDERPQHAVTVAPFWMGQMPVTQAQWRAVAALPQEGRKLEADPSAFKGADRPVEQVSWHDAVEFCRRLSKHSGCEYRLPSEAEWEYACRAGTTTPFHFGETLTSALANYDATSSYGSGPKGDYRGKSTKVGSFPANAFGLHDMHGNVWECCQDHWHKNYADAPSDDIARITGGDASRRVLRGGSWNDFPRFCRSATRRGFRPDVRDFDVGFRVCCLAPRALL